ncbi:MAG: hypothetical protein J6T17_06490 [Clostridia bacterium]|nr:hypothetical protein [Clostridia bacterium]
MDLFKLVGSVFVDTDQANSSLAKTDKNAEKTGVNFKQLAGKAAAVGTAVVGAATAAVGGMIKMAKESSATADTVDKASQRMQVSTDTYQELAHAASLSGVEMSTLEQAAVKLAGTDLSLDDALAQIYELESAEDRAALAAELFGDKVAYNLTPMLNASGPEFQAMRDEAHELGLVMDETSVKAGANLNDAISKVTDSISMMATNLGASLMPLVQQVMDFIIENLPLIQGMFDMLVPILSDLFTELMPPLMDLARTLLPVIMELIKTLLPPITQIIKMLLPIIVQFMETFMPLFVELAQTVLPILLELITALMPIIRMVATILTTVLGGAIKALMPIIQTLGTIFTKIFNGIASVAKSVLNGVIGFLNILIDGLNIFLAPLRAVIAGVASLIGKPVDFANIKIPNIPTLAKGGDVEGGHAIVGEDGPELLSLTGGGARVTPLNDNNNAFVSVEKKLDTLIAILKNGFAVNIDGSRMVGALAPAMNQALGQMTASERRAFA